MASVNKVILLGRLGQDPDARETQSGMRVVGLSVATSRRYKDKQGERREETEWHKVTCFGRVAEIAERYLQKGSEVYVEGRLHTKKYTGKDGVERYATEVLCESLQLGARPKDGAAPAQAPAGQGDSQTAPDDDVPF